VTPEPPTIDSEDESFVKRAFIVFLMAALAYVSWRLADLAVLTFGAVLFSIALNAAAAAIARRTHAPHALSLTIVVLLGLAAVGLAMTLFGSIIAGQIDDLMKGIPQGFRIVVERIQASPFGRYALEQARSFDIAGSTGWIASSLALFARSALQALAYAFLVFFLAIYLAAQPTWHRRMLLRLLPPRRQAALSRVFDATGDILRRWLVGQFIVMAIIGVLSGFGLWLLGIESAIVLGLVGGFLCFIPYVGAVIAAVPATLVALTQGPSYALSVLAMYAAVHFVEGNFITPFVQAEATSLPPVLSLLSIVGFGILFGPGSVLIAAPLTLFLMVVVELLYVEETLGQAPAATSTDLL
jgi:predicted PurR-regulated permease PerM